VPNGQPCARPLRYLGARRQPGQPPPIGAVSKPDPHVQVSWRADASDGEPGDSLQGGAFAAADAAEAPASEGPEGLAGTLPLAAQPQGRTQQQQQQHVQ
ncbi:hypothetical protein DKP78_14600, partial [Enterococcus faecium]